MVTTMEKAEDWILMAASDLDRAIRLFKDEDFSGSVLHAQLAVEKLQKSLLALAGIEVKRTHVPSRILLNQLVKSTRNTKIEISDKIKDMDLKNTKTLLNYIKKLKKEFGKELVGVLLFGSVAKETDDFESDVDLIIIIQNLPRIPERFDIKAEIEGLEGAGVDSLWITPQELSTLVENKTPLILNAFSEGKVLYDPKKFIETSKRKLVKDLRRSVVKETKDAWIWPVKKLGAEVVL